jgi:hypothetical protein
MKPMLHAGALATSNVEPSREHAITDKPLSSPDSFGEATFAVRKTKRASSSDIRGTGFDIRDPVTKAIENMAFQSGTKVQSLTGNQSSIPPSSNREVGYSLKTSIKRKEPELAIDCPSRLPTSAKFEPPLETIRRSDTLKFTTPSVLGQRIVSSLTSNKRRGEPKGRDMINANTSPNPIQDSHIDIELDSSASGTARCRWYDDAPARTDMATARNTPEGGFYWGQNMNDDLIGQLGHVKTNTNYEFEGVNHIMGYESTAVDIGPEHYYPISCQAVGSGGSIDEMDGDVNDADLIALLTSQHDSSHSYTKPETTRVLGGHSSTDNLKAPTGNFLVAENPELFYSSSGRNSSDEEQDFFFGIESMNDMTQISSIAFGATERFLLSSNLQCPFDDSSQTLEVYGADLRGSMPPAGEESRSDHTICAGDTRHETSVSVANTSFGGEYDGILHRAAEVTDRVLAITDDELGTIDEGCANDRDSGSADVNELSLPRDSTGDSTSRQKLCVRTLGPLESVGPSTPAKCKLLPHLLEYDASGQPKPFARPAFPERVQDRSPIVGLSSKTFLRTCFRVGEALRAGSHAVRWSQDAIVELYARVVFSSRNGWKQHFQFADLFHDRPPFLSGTYEIFHGVDLWERDGGRFLTEEGKGKMCRCVGRMKRAGANWKLVVLNIWEATWDDVAWAKGIVCA